MSTRSTPRMGIGNSSIPRRPASLKNVDPNSPLNQLREAHLKFHLKCRVCKTPYELSDLKANIEAWFNIKDDDHIPALYCLSACACRKCGTSTCAGCGLKPNKNSSTTANADTAATEDEIQNCCEQGRLFGIWMALCRFDEHELEPKAKTEAPVATKAPQAKPRKAKDRKYPLAKGVGYDYGSDWDDFDVPIESLPPAGASVVAASVAAAAAAAAAITKALDDRDALDNYMMATIHLLIRLLCEPVTFESVPDKADTLLLFRTSLIMDRICALVRNDSISDMTQRCHMYNEIFAFLQLIRNDDDLCQLLFDKQPSRTQSPGLRVLSYGTSKDQHSLTLSGDQPSLLDCFKNTYKQAIVFLDLSKNIKRGKAKMASDSEAADMCKTIVEFYDGLDNDMAVEESEHCSTEDIKDEWTKFSEENQVTFTDDVLKNHRFSKSFPSLRLSSKDRMITISKEISNMTTSLPAGVFVKVAESRADVMKVLIIGVEGSPYAGGIFIFDLMLPQNYPNSPPKMAFVLEGVDSEAPPMNPNLHPGGSVCLSILNTWSGHQSQMWQPGRSTVLAVLVSVQAMILGAPLPLLNEPGLAMLGDSPEVIEHKRHVQVKTIKHAMIAWLVKCQTSTDEKKPEIWGDLVNAYWKHNGKAVLRTVEEWTLDNSLIKAYDKTAFPSLNMWANGFGHPVTQKKVKAVIEDLAEKLEGLVSSFFNEGEAPTDSTSSKASEGQSLNSSEGSSTADTSISGVSSITTSSGAEVAGVKKKSSGKGKRKESANATEPTKEKNKKGSKRRKIKTEGDAYGSDSENAVNDVLPQGKSKLHSGASKEEVHMSSTHGRWTYTGGRSMKEVRDACHAFDLTPARSINESIERLEDHVNDQGKGNHELALAHGMIKNPFN